MKKIKIQTLFLITVILVTFYQCNLFSKKSCPAPTGLHLDSEHFHNDSVDIKVGWNKVSTANKYEVVATDSNTNISDTLIVTDTTATFNSLISKDTHFIKVASICNGHVGPFSPPLRVGPGGIVIIDSDMDVICTNGNTHALNLVSSTHCNCPPDVIKIYDKSAFLSLLSGSQSALTVGSGGCADQFKIVYRMFNACNSDSIGLTEGSPSFVSESATPSNPNYIPGTTNINNDLLTFINSVSSAGNMPSCMNDNSQNKKVILFFHVNTAPDPGCDATLH